MLTTQQIERLNEPKLWIHNQKSAPTTYKYSHSSRCVFCMSIMHRSEKCSTKNPPFATPVPLGKG